MHLGAVLQSPELCRQAGIDRLLDDDRVALAEPILTELLIGFRRKEHADWVASMLRGVHFWSLTWEDYRSAASLGQRLIAAGHSLPLSDLLLAAVALHRNIAVYTVDPHFDLIPGLIRHET